MRTRSYLRKAALLVIPVLTAMTALGGGVAARAGSQLECYHTDGAVYSPNLATPTKGVTIRTALAYNSYVGVSCAFTGVDYEWAVSISQPAGAGWYIDNNSIPLMTLPGRTDQYKFEDWFSNDWEYGNPYSEVWDDTGYLPQNGLIEAYNWWNQNHNGDPCTQSWVAMENSIHGWIMEVNINGNPPCTNPFGSNGTGGLQLVG